MRSTSGNYKTTTVRSKSEEIEAMAIICNIQMMQDKVHGKHFGYYEFNANTLDELRDLQGNMIKEYNDTFKPQS